MQNGKRSGDDRVLGYASRGISFVAEHETRQGDEDPVVSTMAVVPPAVARTSSGLFIGMPESAAMAALDEHYLVTRDLRSRGPGMLELTDKPRRAREIVSFRSSRRP